MQAQQQWRRPGRLSLAVVGTAAAAAAAVSGSQLALNAFVGLTPAPTPTVAVRGGGSARFLRHSLRSYRGQEAKASLLEMLDDAELMKEIGGPAGKSTRGRLDEAILELERECPIDEPAHSELLDGTWMLKYAGWFASGLLTSPTRELALFLYGGGFSLAGAVSSFADGFWGKMIGLKIGTMTVSIRDGREVQSSLELEIGTGMKQNLSYHAELKPLSGKRLAEDILSVDVPSFMGKFDAPLRVPRGILVTYIDEDIMVVRDESGIAEILGRNNANAAYSPSEAANAHGGGDGAGDGYGP